MPFAHPWAAPNSASRFPSPPEPGSNNTCIDWVHPCVRFAQGSAECIRNGSKYQNTCIAGRSAARTCISDIAQPVRRLMAAECRIVRNGKPYVCLASVWHADQRFPSWAVFRRNAFAVPRPCRGPDTRVGDTSVTREAPWCKRYCLASSGTPQVCAVDSWPCLGKPTRMYCQEKNTPRVALAGAIRISTEPVGNRFVMADHRAEGMPPWRVMNCNSPYRVLPSG
jgi:hypothetical protein